MVVGAFGLARVPVIVNRSGLPVEPVDDRTWEEDSYNEADEHFDSKEDEAEEKRRIFPGRESPDQGDVCHTSVVGNERGCKEGRKEWRGSVLFTISVIIGVSSACDQKHVKTSAYTSLMSLPKAFYESTRNYIVCHTHVAILHRLIVHHDNDF